MSRIGIPAYPNDDQPQPGPDYLIYLLLRILARVRRQINLLTDTGDEIGDWCDRARHHPDSLLGPDWAKKQLPPARGFIDDVLGEKLAKLGLVVRTDRKAGSRAKITLTSPELRDSWTLSLSPALVDTLEALCEDFGPAGPDGLVCWKSISHLAWSLKDRFGNSLKTRAATVRVARLRRALEDAGVSSQLVQRDHDRYRFARKSAASPEIPEITGNTA